jgi:hypothetical protein
VGAVSVTGGYMVIPARLQVLLRGDSDSGDGVSLENHWVLLGVNGWVTSIFGLQLNDVIPVEEAAANHQILLDAQIAF